MFACVPRILPTTFAACLNKWKHVHTEYCMPLAIECPMMNTAVQKRNVTTSSSLSELIVVSLSALAFCTAQSNRFWAIERYITTMFPCMLSCTVFEGVMNSCGEVQVMSRAFIWRCMGKGGGAEALCYAAKPTPPPKKNQKLRS